MPLPPIQGASPCPVFWAGACSRLFQIFTNILKSFLHGRQNAAQFFGRRSVVHFLGMAHPCAQYPAELLKIAISLSFPCRACTAGKMLAKNLTGCVSVAALVKAHKSAKPTNFGLRP
jgi:hypothetical protein